MDVKPFLKRVLYWAGALGRYHRIRNRHRLTVTMFHRILDDRDPRWQSADPTWTVSRSLFAGCLAFFRDNYAVIGIADLLAACERRKPLPERPLLITLDDGWADNAEYALETLRSAGLPATVFVVAGAVGQPQPDAGAGRTPLGEALGRNGCNPEAMLSLPQLRRLHAAGLTIGAHGLTHIPIPAAADAAKELWEPRLALARMLGEREGPVAFSFPHGVYDTRSVQEAFHAGYRLVFHSDLCLTECPDGYPGAAVFGRIHVPASAISDASGRLCPERLALWLFTRPNST